MKDEKDWGPADYAAQGQVLGVLAVISFIAVLLAIGFVRSFFQW